MELILGHGLACWTLAYQR